MARTEPWELTQAFAEQLMRQAATTEQETRRLQLAPIEQQMALDRLKQVEGLKLSMLPQELGIRERYAERAEGRREAADVRGEERGEKRLVGREQRAGEREIAGDIRRAELGKEARREATEQEVEKAEKILESRIRKLKEDPEAAARALGRGSIAPRPGAAPKRPPTRPNHEVPVVLPRDPYAQEEFFNQLVKEGYERPTIADIEGGENNATNWLHPRRKGVPSAPPPSKTTPAPSKTEQPRPPANIPFEGVPPNIPTFPKLDLGGKDKMSFLYESIRRRGYTDAEAKQILASLEKPEVTPTDNPDIFDVLVA